MILKTIPGLIFSLLFTNNVIPVSAAMGSCSSTDKCDTGCCSKEGYCGFGPDFCGDDVCISSCDAIAECGGMILTLSLR